VQINIFCAIITSGLNTSPKTELAIEVCRSCNVQFVDLFTGKMWIA